MAKKKFKSFGRLTLVQIEAVGRSDQFKLYLLKCPGPMSSSFLSYFLSSHLTSLFWFLFVLRSVCLVVVSRYNTVSLRAAVN